VLDVGGRDVALRLGDMRPAVLEGREPLAIGARTGTIGMT
jgi:hypothetical protein